MSTVQVLESDQRPAIRCKVDEIFVQEDEAGAFWVQSWDGREAFDLGDALPTREQAIAAAIEALAQR